MSTTTKKAGPATGPAQRSSATAAKVPPPDDEGQSVLQAALEAACLGYRVHPLRPGEKVPILPAWQDRATTDADTIATWLTVDFTTAGLGIAAGQGLLVLDVDGPAGREQFAALVAEHGKIPGHRVRTPSGGFHLYLNVAPGVITRNSVGKVADNIDLRGDGGYVVAAPTVLADGRRYWASRPLPRLDALPLAPEWLLALARRVETPAALVTPARSWADTPTDERAHIARSRPGLVARQTARLDALQEAATPQRSAYRGAPWDDTTLAVACELVRIANLASPDPAAELARMRGELAAHAPRDADWGDADHDRIWRSAVSRVGRQVAALPLRPLEVPEPVMPAWRADAFTAAEVFPGDRLDPEALARIADPHGDLALGIDQQVWRYEGGRYVPDDDVIAKRVRQVLRSRYRREYPSLARDMVTLADGFPKLTDDVRDPELINTRTGMLHWPTQTLRPHSPNYRSASQVAAGWDPSVTCPTVDRWLANTVAPDVLPAVWEAIAYTLLPDTPLQKAVLLLGPGRTGKGTLIRLLEAVLGTENCSTLTIPAMSNRFEPAQLVGKIANLNADAEATHIGDAAPFKRVIGSDRITGEHKYGTPFNFRPRATCWVCSNEVPSSNDPTTGWLRRFLVLPFDRMMPLEGFSEAALHAEADGVLTKAARLLPELMARGLFTESPSMLAPLAAMAEASDVVKLWLNDDGAILLHDPGAQVRTPRSEVYGAFRTWCMTENHRQLSGSKFYDRLRALGYEVGAGGTRAVRGIDIRSRALVL